MSDEGRLVGEPDLRWDPSILRRIGAAGCKRHSFLPRFEAVHLRPPVLDHPKGCLPNDRECRPRDAWRCHVSESFDGSAAALCWFRDGR
jgi:hypothetical protein